MKAQAFFSNSSTDVRLVITDYDGNTLPTMRFERVSSMVNYCEEHGITLTVADCLTEA